MSRQLALDMAAIDLNRTTVAFGHDNDTFGWYFYPRIQSPPTEKSNIAATARLLWSGGPTEHYDSQTLGNRTWDARVRSADRDAELCTPCRL